MAARKTCADRLQELRKDMGIKKEEYGKRREYSSLPVFNLGPTKKEKKKLKKAEKRLRYELANWYLNVYLKPKFRREVLYKYLEFEELVEYCYIQALVINKVFRQDSSKMDLDPDTLVSPDPMTDFDIPDYLWEEYGRYCKEHPIKKASDIKKRREKFINNRNKRRKEYYKKGLMLYDPIFKHCQLNEKRMIENLKRITVENAKRCEEFHAMMDKLVGNKGEGSQLMKSFDSKTKDVQARVKRHLKDLEKNAEPLPFYIDD